MLRSLLHRLRRRRASRLSEDRVRIERTDHGWLIYYQSDDPATRYLPVPDEQMRRLRRRAESEYRERQQRAALVQHL